MIDGKSVINKYEEICRRDYALDTSLYEKYHVKRGLRDKSGQGVVAGITNISKIVSYKDDAEGKHIPCDGELYYRGYSINDLVNGLIKDDRFGFEEIAYLLILGELPDKKQLEEFKTLLAEMRKLPRNFTKDVILKAPSKDMMMSLQRSVLTLASYDKKFDDIGVNNVIRQCLWLVSVFPMLAVYGYHAYNHFINDDSLYIHHPDPDLSTAENFLRMLRPDKSFTPLVRTRALRRSRRACSTLRSYFIWSTAAATTRRSPRAWSPRRGRTPIRRSRRRLRPSRAPSTAAPTSR